MRVQSLDGLRAVLALWVVLAHLGPAVGLRIPTAANPAVAVDLFMVLSGFLIAATHERLSAVHGPFKGDVFFWIRRVMRIWPLYLVLLALAWLFIGPLREAKGFSDAVLAGRALPEGVIVTTGDQAGPSAADVLWHVSMLFGLNDQQATSTPLPDWSLSLEFQFYLLFPLIALGYRRSPLLTCLAAAVIAYISPRLFGDYTEPGLYAHFRQPALIAYRLNFFLVGCICFYLFSPQPPDAAPRPAREAHLVALLLCLSVAGVRSALGIIAVVYVLSFPASTLCRWLGHPVMAWMGRISFSVYLCHILLLRAVVAALATQDWFVALPPPARFVLAAVLLVPPVLALSHLLYRWIETPGNRLAHRWTSAQPPGPRAPRMAEALPGAPGPV